MSEEFNPDQPRDDDGRWSGDGGGGGKGGEDIDASSLGTKAQYSGAVAHGNIERLPDGKIGLAQGYENEAMTSHMAQDLRDHVDVQTEDANDAVARLHGISKEEGIRRVFSQNHPALPQPAESPGAARAAERAYEKSLETGITHGKSAEDDHALQVQPRTSSQFHVSTLDDEIAGAEQTLRDEQAKVEEKKKYGEAYNEYELGQARGRLERLRAKRAGR